MNLKGLLKRTFFFKNPNFSLGVTLIFLPALFFDRQIRVISFILIVILFFTRKINNKLNKIYKVSGIHLQRRAFKNSSFDTVLIGGSNAYFGINTSLFNNINCINLSIPAEDGDFDNYCSFLKRLKIKSDKIIYSTLNLTQLSNKNNLYLKSKNPQLNKNNKLNKIYKVSGIHLQRRAFKNSSFDTVLIGGSNAYFELTHRYLIILTVLIFLFLPKMEILTITVLF